jgi:hypothetical protein
MDWNKKWLYITVQDKFTHPHSFTLVDMYIVAVST